MRLDVTQQKIQSHLNTRTLGSVTLNTYNSKIIKL